MACRVLTANIDIFASFSAPSPSKGGEVSSAYSGQFHSSLYHSRPESNPPPTSVSKDVFYQHAGATSNGNVTLLPNAGNLNSGKAAEVSQQQQNLWETEFDIPIEQLTTFDHIEPESSGPSDQLPVVHEFANSTNVDTRLGGDASLQSTSAAVASDSGSSALAPPPAAETSLSTTFENLQLGPEDFQYQENEHSEAPQTISEPATLPTIDNSEPQHAEELWRGIVEVGLDTNKGELIAFQTGHTPFEFQNASDVDEYAGVASSTNNLPSGSYAQDVTDYNSGSVNYAQGMAVDANIVSVCPSCSIPNGSSANFCANCGFRIAPANSNQSSNLQLTAGQSSSLPASESYIPANHYPAPYTLSDPSSQYSSFDLNSSAHSAAAQNIGRASLTEQAGSFSTPPWSGPAHTASQYAGQESYTPTSTVPYTTASQHFGRSASVPPQPEAGRDPALVDKFQPKRSKTPSHTVNRYGQSIHPSQTGVVTSAVWEGQVSEKPTHVLPSHVFVDTLGRTGGHCLASFSASGRLTYITVTRQTRYVTDRQGQSSTVRKCYSSAVTLQSVNQVLSQTVKEKFQQFPAPLVGPKAKLKKKDILAYIDQIQCSQYTPEITQSEDHSSTLFDTHEAENFSILLCILKVIIEHDGLPSSFLAKFDLSEIKKILLLADAPKGTSPHAMIEDALVDGKLEEAYEIAIAHRLWSYALILAAFAGKQTYNRVVALFIASECERSPGFRTDAGSGENLEEFPVLKFFVQLCAGSDLDCVAALFVQQNNNQEFNPDISGSISHWRRILCLLLANRAQTNQMMIVALGDRLRQLNLEMAAQCCFLFCDPSLVGGTESTKSRIAMIGVSHVHRPLTYFRGIVCFRLTEIYEFSQTLKGRGTDGILPHFQAHKLLYGHILADLGMRDLSQKYFDSVEYTLKGYARGSPYFHRVFVESLAILSSRLHLSNPQAVLTGKDPGGWLSKISSFGVRKLDRLMSNAIGENDPILTSGASGPGDGNINTSTQYPFPVQPGNLDGTQIHTDASLTQSPQNMPNQDYYHGMTQPTYDGTSSLSHYQHDSLGQQSWPTTQQSYSAHYNYNNADSTTGDSGIAQYIHMNTDPTTGYSGNNTAQYDYTNTDPTAGYSGNNTAQYDYTNTDPTTGYSGNNTAQYGYNTTDHTTGHSGDNTAQYDYHPTDPTTGYSGNNTAQYDYNSQGASTYPQNNTTQYEYNESTGTPAYSGVNHSQPDYNHPNSAYAYPGASDPQYDYSSASVAPTYVGAGNAQYDYSVPENTVAYPVDGGAQYDVNGYSHPQAGSYSETPGEDNTQQHPDEGRHQPHLPNYPEPLMLGNPSTAEDDHPTAYYGFQNTPADYRNDILQQPMHFQPPAQKKAVQDHGISHAQSEAHELQHEKTNSSIYNPDFTATGGDQTIHSYGSQTYAGSSNARNDQVSNQTQNSNQSYLPAADDDDLGLNNSSASKRGQNATQDNKSRGSEQDSKSKDNLDDKTTNEKSRGIFSAFGSLFGARGKAGEEKQAKDVGNIPTKANLGEKSAFFYDEKLKKWVNKKGGAQEDEAKSLPPPPMSKSASAPVSRLATPGPPNALTGDDRTSSMVPEAPHSMGIGGVANKRAGGTRRGARNRYVDVFNPNPSQSTNSPPPAASFLPAATFTGAEPRVLTPVLAAHSSTSFTNVFANPANPYETLREDQPSGHDYPDRNEALSPATIARVAAAPTDI
ncbi:Sec23-binding domain of Sec16-domain-containing protein [Phlyctochytrium arcticum]|nr:Sec23-binding domain of Sec16-domain-containing protein [Phlyctochytrium arcticum]